jgi:hypothetical protein
MGEDRSDDGGLIDVTGLSPGDLASLDDVTLGRALDYILAVSDNSVGFHGFNNLI